MRSATLFCLCFAGLALAQRDEASHAVPIRFAPVIMAKMVASYTVPNYPAASLRARREGLVVAALQTDESGKVVSVDIHIAPDDEIRAVVARTLVNWTFQPAIVHGVAHPALGRIFLYFQCKGTSGEVIIPDITDKAK